MAGNDTFNFEGIAGGGDSNVPADLIIDNTDGSNINNLSDLLINGDLDVNKAGAAASYSELTIRDTTIIGDTDIDNDGGLGGDTKTTIDNSSLQGGIATALILTNGDGADVIEVLGNSQFGTGLFIGGQPQVSITTSQLRPRRGSSPPWRSPCRCSTCGNRSGPERPR